VWGAEKKFCAPCRENRPESQVVVVEGAELAGWGGGGGGRQAGQGAWYGKGKKK